VKLARAALFFAPHLAIVVVIASAERLGWERMLRAVAVAALLLPIWCRLVGRGWSLEVRYLLGAGLATVGFVGLFLWVWMNMEGPNDWTLAAMILGFTMLFVPYSIYVTFWTR
jgi:hypothetical protein